MRDHPLVLLVGDSLLMDSVADSLARSNLLEFNRLDFIENGELIKALKPEYIVFELDTPQADAVLALLRKRPGTLLLGVDPNCSRVIVMNSQEFVTRSMKELNHLFEIELGLDMEIE